MAGLNRKVLNSRRITKLVAPSNPVFNRSFITSFGVAFIKEERNVGLSSLPPLFFYASPGSLCDCVINKTGVNIRASH